MPTTSVNGVEIYYEETGHGTSLVFSHEFGGDYRSWADQVRYARWGPTRRGTSRSRIRDSYGA